jgi:NADH:ubiquinone oxidoreductase subunit H
VNAQSQAAAPWVATAVQAAAWLCLFLGFVLGRQALERWLIARFHGSGGPPSIPLASWLPSRPQPPAGVRAMRGLAAITALLAGAMVPLGPPFRVGGWPIRLDLFGDASLAVALLLVLDWASGILLALSDQDARSPARGGAGHQVAGALFSMLPTTLVALTLMISASSLHLQEAGNLRSTAWIELQGAWSGLRWLGLLQPLALVLWLACAAPCRPGPRTRATFAWQVHALNRALLASLLLAGGWQGPLAGQFAWLGVAYTAVKVGLFAAVWTWAWASQPPASALARARVTWSVSAPLAAINLLVTAVVVALR